MKHRLQLLNTDKSISNSYQLEPNFNYASPIELATKKIVFGAKAIGKVYLQFKFEFDLSSFKIRFFSV